MNMDRRNVLKMLGALGGASAAGAGSLWSRTAFAQANSSIKLGFISSLSGAQAP
ncbi:MAG: twin-arginine translocation signal domain-containing protein, partial [Rhodospirillaceae bacterium]|nr:twin-arginine translocation signal domain-containing protein [Rhodospirillaceae bacterium]